MKHKTKRLWIRNTSRYASSEVFILCRTALESVQANLAPNEHLLPVIIKVTGCSDSFRGRAHWTEHERCGSRLKGRPERLKKWLRVLVRIGAPKCFPHHVSYPKFKDMPEYEFRSYREALVGVTAHEIAHTLGHDGNKGGETMCEMYAWDAVEYYRKHQAEIDTEISRQIFFTTEHQKRVADAKSPQARREKKLQLAQAGLARWEHKLKLANTKVKNYRRLVNRIQKTQKTVYLQQPEPLAQAATDSKHAQS